VAEVLGKRLETASPDLLWDLLKTMVEALMGAGADGCYRARGGRPRRWAYGPAASRSLTADGEGPPRDPGGMGGAASQPES
jgi:hypothetical protein